MREMDAGLLDGEQSRGWLLCCDGDEEKLRNMKTLSIELILMNQPNRSIDIYAVILVF